MIPCVQSNWLRCVLCSSSPSTPVSAISLKMVANFGVVAEMIFSTWLVVGIIGIGSTHLNFGFCHWSPFVLQNQSYASVKETFEEFVSFAYAMACFTSSGFIRSDTLELFESEVKAS